MKKVLLLGDSIRLSYQPFVRNRLDGLADVSGPEDNGRFVKYTLWYVNEWIGQIGKPDVIHWNNGLWDIFMINKDIGLFSTVEEYLHDIGRVLQELRKTQAQIIWATTTPVSSTHPYCANETIDLFNEKASAFMRKEQIPINDLNLLLRGDLESHICPDKIHLSEKAKTLCAQAVSNAVAEYL